MDFLTVFARFYAFSPVFSPIIVKVSTIIVNFYSYLFIIY